MAEATMGPHKGTPSGEAAVPSACLESGERAEQMLVSNRCLLARVQRQAAGRRDEERKDRLMKKREKFYLL